MAVPESTDGKRVLGIVGSPRLGGNTEVLVDEVLAGAAEAGAAVARVTLSQAEVRPCQACDGCSETRVCVQQDGFAAILEQLLASQVWVLGTPVYWWGPSAQFKAFVDRWYSVRRELFVGRRVVLVVPLADSADGACHVVGMLTDALTWLEADVVATLVAPGAWERGAVRQQEGLMSLARRAGREAVAHRAP